MELKIHIVKAGDTLYSIAQKYGVTLEEIVKLNPIIANPNEIVVGLKVKVPSAAAQPGEPDLMHKHVVQEGDTLWKLSKAWGVSLNEMIKVNPQLANPNVLNVGETVNIPKAMAGPGMLPKPGMGAAHPVEAGGKTPTHQVTPFSAEFPPIPIKDTQKIEPSIMPEKKQVDCPDPGKPMQHPHTDLFKQFQVPAVKAGMAELPSAPQYGAMQPMQLPTQYPMQQPMQMQYPMQQMPATTYGGYGPTVMSTPDQWPCYPNVPITFAEGQQPYLGAPAPGPGAQGPHLSMMGSPWMPPQPPAFPAQPMNYPYGGYGMYPGMSQPMEEKPCNCGCNEPARLSESDETATSAASDSRIKSKRVSKSAKKAAVRSTTSGKAKASNRGKGNKPWLNR